MNILDRLNNIQINSDNMLILRVNFQHEDLSSMLAPQQLYLDVFHFVVVDNCNDLSEKLCPCVDYPGSRTRTTLLSVKGMVGYYHPTGLKY